MKKLSIHSEIIYLIGIIIIALSVSLAIASNFGLSVLNVPAYVISNYFGISMTLAEYLVQFTLLIIFCIVMRSAKFTYLFCFVTGLIYGLVLKLFQFIPFLNPSNEMCQNLPIIVRIIFMVLGIYLLGLAIALFGMTYLCPTIYDLFIIAVPKKYKLNQLIFKIVYDSSFLIIGIILSLILLHKLVGVHFGTIMFVALTGPSISLNNKLIKKTIETKPLFPRIAAIFEEKNEIREEN